MPKHSNYILGCNRAFALVSTGHGHDVIEMENAMDREHHDDELVELGTASDATKGGPMGFEDSERTLWLHALGLSED